MHKLIALNILLLSVSQAKESPIFIDLLSLSQYKSLMQNIDSIARSEKEITFYGKSKEGITKIRIVCYYDKICNEKSIIAGVRLGFANKSSCEKYSKLLFKRFGEPDEYLNIKWKGFVVMDIISYDAIWRFNKESRLEFIMSSCSEDNLISVVNRASVMLKEVK